MELQESAKKLAEVFDGLQLAYGTYLIDESSNGTKRKGRANVLKTPRTTETWTGHVSGKGVAIGIIPINEQDSCVWGCIDVDTYPLDHKNLIEDIRKAKAPLVVCRSKSGGAHLFLFTTEWIEAKQMQETLEKFASELGYSGSEIFPKQIALDLERGDVGNFLNLPYYDAEDGMRYAIKDDGQSATIEEFFGMVEKYKQTPEQVTALNLRAPVSNIIISDGPPCLQYLCEHKIGEGARNNGIFNLAVYLRKASPDDLAGKLHDYNSRFIDPPLLTGEVNAVAAQMARKEYNYKCKDEPIKSHCDKALCRTRRFGIGGDSGGSGDSLANLRKYDSVPPVWFVDVSGMPLELGTDGLLTQVAFQKSCIDQLNVFPPTVRKEVWERTMARLLTEMSNTEGSVIAVSQDSSIPGQFYGLLEEFCNNMQQAETKDQVLLKRPYTNEEGTITSFRLADFTTFLHKNNFREYKAHRITQRLRDIQGEPQVIKIKGKSVRVWAIPAFDNFDAEGLPTKTGSSNGAPF